MRERAGSANLGGPRPDGDQGGDRERKHDRQPDGLDDRLAHAEAAEVSDVVDDVQELGERPACAGRAGEVAAERMGCPREEDVEPEVETPDVAEQMLAVGPQKVDADDVTVEGVRCGCAMAPVVRLTVLVAASSQRATRAAEGSGPLLRVAAPRTSVSGPEMAKLLRVANGVDRADATFT